MKQIALACLLFSAIAFAQTNPSNATISGASGVLSRGTSEWGVFASGGTGIGKRSSTQVVGFGGRWGRVLTGDHGPGWIRGNFEVKIEVLPFEAFLEPPVNAYGAEFRPLNLVWNFKGNRTVRPFAELGGGLLLTNHDVPVRTNNVNFSPQGGAGFHFYTRPARAITFESKYFHVSNAGLERRNSGINAGIQFVLGYTWFR